MYVEKTSEEITKTLINYLPQGEIYKGFSTNGSNMNILIKSFAKIFNVLDSMIADSLKGLRIDENCPYLDDWYNELQLNRFIVRPKSNEMLAKIILAFLRARKGIFSAKEIEDFIYDIFGITIKVELLPNNPENSNTFECTFEIVFYDTEDPGLVSQYSVIIYFPKGSLSNGVNNPEDPYTAIRKLLTYFININYKIFFREVK